MIKWVSMKPIVEKRVYLKFGFVIVKSQVCLCPKCYHTVNAGPNYQPDHCDKCGQRLKFDDIEWEKDEELGFAVRRRPNEQIEDRVV